MSQPTPPAIGSDGTLEQPSPAESASRLRNCFRRLHESSGNSVINFKRILQHFKSCSGVELTLKLATAKVFGSINSSRAHLSRMI